MGLGSFSSCQYVAVAERPIPSRFTAPRNLLRITARVAAGKPLKYFLATVFLADFLGMEFISNVTVQFIYMATLLLDSRKILRVAPIFTDTSPNFPVKSILRGPSAEFLELPGKSRLGTVAFDLPHRLNQRHYLLLRRLAERCLFKLATCPLRPRFACATCARVRWPTSTGHRPP